MAITSTDERISNRLSELETKFDAFVSQDRIGSQVYTQYNVPYGSATGALTSSVELRFSKDGTNDATRTAQVGSELSIENDATGGVRYAGLRLRAVDSVSTIRSVARILGTFLAPTYNDSAIIMQTANNSETFRDVVTIRGAKVGVINNTPLYPIDVQDANTQLRFGAGAVDSGGFLISTAANQAVMAGGAMYNGTNWIAKATGATSIHATGGSFSIFNDTGLTAGNSFTPTSRFSVDANGIANVTGSYRVANTQVVAARRTGYTNAMTGTANRATSYATSTITLVQLAERVKAIQDDLTTHGLIGV